MESPTSTANSANKAEFYPGSINKITFNEGVFTFECQNQVTIKVTVLTDDIIRVRYGIENVFEDDFSYALSSKFEKNIVNLDTSETDDAYFIHTSTLDIELRKSNAAVTMLNKQGKIICQDEKGFHWEDNHTYGGHIVEMSKNIQEGECFFGMGDKPVKSNLRGRRFENWGSDVYGYQKDQDPLYKNIPFYMGCHSGMAYGIFFDNSFRSYFDFGHERGTTSSFWAHGGEMNYYFFNGPNLMDVSARYSKLTGVPELPPMWALGYHQCKWSYYPEEQVKGITSKMRELAIPCDAIYLDIDYMDGFRCFTWDLEKFPEPKRMIQELKDDGFKTVVIIDPGIKVDKDYWVFKEGLEKDVFCRRADGPFMKGKVWPGDCYFPDYTNPEVREWWTTLFEELIADCQVAGVWNDMNEPAVMEVESKTFPNDVRHDYDGHPCSHRKAHNVYGMQMSRATYDGVKKFSDNKRPFIITRSCYSGVQRYTSAWTGDNIATWEHLWLSNMQCQRLSISGLSFIGSDIGGFIDQPTPELYARWIQLAVFHPLCRTHSSGNHGDQEPWSFGEQTTDIVRKYIELRYKLLPYLYSSFYQYTKDGYPILRPLAFIDQADPNLLHRGDEFMFGSHVLISPVLKENSKGKYVYLPRNNWYNYWTGEMIIGGQEQWVDAPLETMPIFVKAGSILPHYPIQQYVGEKVIDQLTLIVYFNEGTMESELYEDDGEGYEYEKGIYTLKTFEQISDDSSTKIAQTISGHFKASYQTYKLVFIGVPYEIKEVSAIGEIQKQGLNADGNYEIEIASSFTELILSK